MQHNNTLAVYHCSTNLWKLLHFAMKLSRHCVHRWRFWATRKEKNEMCLALFSGLISHHPLIRKHLSREWHHVCLQCLGRQRGEMKDVIMFFTLNNEWYVFQLHYLDKHDKKKPQACLNSSHSPPILCLPSYLDRCWQQSCNKCSQTFPLHFAYFKWWQWPAWEWG